MNKQIFLENLPTTKCGGNEKGKINIDWRNSVGYSIYFIYGDIDGYITIDSYNSKNKLLNVFYNGQYFNIHVSNLKKCKIGKIIKVITNDFKVEIGQVFKDSDRNLTIIDRKYNKRQDKRRNSCYDIKYYKYKCNKCKNEDWISEYDLLKRIGCNTCCISPQKVVRGINDIATTNPELVKYFVNIEDAYAHTYSSAKKVWMKCIDCGFEKFIKINSLYSQGFSCPICSDGISYPEKVMGNLLKQLKIEFKTQLSKTTYKWCNKYKYDFYFIYNNEEYIIETHGMQHYVQMTGYTKRTLEEEQKNDKYKIELAIKNGIANYIVIDCRYSEIDFIKNNILQSKLNELFDLNNINWTEINRKSNKSLVKEVCDYWRIHNNINNEGLTTVYVGNIVGLSRGTIEKYLHKGNTLNWCRYNVKDSLNIKNIEVLKEGVSLGIFEHGIQELSRKSEILFGVKLIASSICNVCNNKVKQYKGFTFKYV